MKKIENIEHLKIKNIGIRINKMFTTENTVTMRIILAVDEKTNTCSKIGRKTKTSQSVISSSMFKLINTGLITSERKGRETLLTITEKGLKAKRLVLELRELEI